MSSRLIVLGAFAIWSFICWNWYVCGIKGKCSPAPDERTEQVIQPIVDNTEPSDSSQLLPQEPMLSSTGEDLSTTPTNLDRVQIESLQDRVLIYFPYNSTRRVDNEDLDDYLNHLADALKQSGKTLRITGHTDMVGGGKFNLNLGQQRAHHIRDLLTAKGVAPSQIQCLSKGESQPVATNDTPQGRYKNRRVEIQVKN